MSTQNIKDIIKAEENMLKKNIDTFLSNSERSGNTVTEDGFKTYIATVVKQQMGDLSALSKTEATIVSNSLQNYGTTTLLKRYKTSLVDSPRKPNGKMPVEVSNDFVKSAKSRTSKTKTDLKKKMKALLDESVKTGNTPSASQALNYLSNELDTILSDITDDQEKEFVKSYSLKWIEDSGRFLYDESIKEHPRKVTNTYPWTPTTYDNSKSNKKPSLKPVVYNSPLSIYGKTYKSFSGHDMVCIVELPLSRGGKSLVKVIGNMQTITYSIHDEKHPVRCVGDMNAKRYVFGPRTIAGTLIMTVFNKHWMHEIMEEFVANAGIQAHYLTDELPPFNITISAANEYGTKARLAIYGVTIVNEGQVMSINDVYTENTYEFFAQDIDYMTDLTDSSKSKKGKTDNIPSKKSTPLPDKKASKTGKKTADKSDDETEKNSDPLKPVSPEAIKYNMDERVYLSQLNEDYENAKGKVWDKFNKNEITETQAKREIVILKKAYETKVAEAKKFYEGGLT